jgi:hypothetical protein
MLRRLNSSLLKAGVNIAHYVAKVNDHEGILAVTWKSEPGELGRRLMEMAWNFVDEYTVEHEVELHDEAESASPRKGLHP